MKLIEIVGLGKLLQVIHLPNLIKFFSIISCCDPRKELLVKFAKKFNITYYTSNINTFLKYKKSPYLFICSSREASYEILKKVIKVKKKIFCEKPGIFNLQDAKKIKKQIHSNKKLKFGYMSRYDTSILFLKKYLKKKKKKLEIKKAIFSLNNNAFYNPNAKLDYLRTNEKNDFKFSKINYPKFLKKNIE